MQMRRLLYFSLLLILASLLLITPQAFAVRVLYDDFSAGFVDVQKWARGMVAQEIALRHPQRVDRLVLTGTYARPDAKRRLLLEHWRDIAQSGLPIEALIRERLLWTLLDETLEQTDLINQMISFFVRDGAPLTEEVYARQCTACLEHDTADRLGAIEQPTLVLCGRRDRLTPPSLHRELADEIPNAHLVTIGYGGHLVMAESAEQFNHIVLQFLADLS